ncbi:MAG: CheR family methyltransferase [Bacteroidota bacterium]
MVRDFSEDDLKILYSAVLKKYGIDFSRYLQFSFLRRLDRAFRNLGIDTCGHASVQLIENPVLFDRLLKELSVEETEMFRDPGLWMDMKARIIPEILRTGSKPKIWFVNSTSGDHLISFLILVNEKFRHAGFEIILSSESKTVIENVSAWNCNIKKYETSRQNYSQIIDGGDLKKYFSQSGTRYYYSREDLKNVNFQHRNIFRDSIPGDCNLIFLRNRLIYFDLESCDEILTRASHALVKSGFLILGARERITSGHINERFQVMNKEERIFRKIR